MRVVVFGCGRLGSSLVNRLDLEGHEVAVIDRSAEARGSLAASFGGGFHVGSALDRELLEGVGTADADAFAALTSSDSANVVSARTARDEFHVPAVVARLYDPRRSGIYRTFGITAVAQVGWAVNEISDLLFHRDLTIRDSFGSSDTVLLRSLLPDALDGRRAQDFNVEGSIQVVELTRSGRSSIPGPRTELHAGDLVSFAVRHSDLDRFRSFLGGAQALPGGVVR